MHTTAPHTPAINWPIRSRQRYRDTFRLPRHRQAPSNHAVPGRPARCCGITPTSISLRFLGQR